MYPGIKQKNTTNVPSFGILVQPTNLLNAVRNRRLAEADFQIQGELSHQQLIGLE